VGSPPSAKVKQKKIAGLAAAKGSAAARPASRVPPAGMQLHTLDGSRRYLTGGERDSFLREAEHADRRIRTLCMTLA